MCGVSLPSRLGNPRIGLLAVCCAVAAVGCGTTREQQATNQLVLSDAVDRSISSIDFRPLSGHRVYLDTEYLWPVNNRVFNNTDYAIVNAGYVISSLRQQMVAAGCLLQDKKEDADLIVEARLGALGSDHHRVTYGLPENNALQGAAALVTDGPRFPVLPEIAFARRESRDGAAKVAAFAYDRETRRPVWQSGISQSLANARDTWVLGVGPFRGGTIRGQTTLAGSPLEFDHHLDSDSNREYYERPPVDFTSKQRFQEGWPVIDARQRGLGMVHDQIATELLAPEGAAEPVANVAETATEANEPAQGGNGSEYEPVGVIR